MTHFRLLYKYLIHWFSAINTGGHGVHSPYIYQFIVNVLNHKHYFYIFEDIEQLRAQLKKDKRIILHTDYGTGNNRSQTISSIAQKSLKSARYSKLMYRIIHYLKSENVLELGTSLGITTAYMASASKNINCYSMEGCPQTAAVALENFKKLNINNINIVIGDINNTLKKTINELTRLDFIFIDANHQLDATINYFNYCVTKIHKNSIVIIDDIYRSSEMESAWQAIKNKPEVTSTIDLFDLGIVFFNTDLHKKHYKIRY